jgi:uncharacterized protein YraI
MKWISKIHLELILLAGLSLVFLVYPRGELVLAQQPTGSIPTVTGTPAGALVTVYLDLAQIDIYSGPSSYEYPSIGVLLAGQQVPAYGYSEDGTWIQIYYPGVPDSVAWVYAPYVSISRGAEMPDIESPPTPTPFSTPTIDPTLAAAFIPQETPTRLPTFTPPASINLPSFNDATVNTNRLPMGLIIFALGFIGLLGGMISFLRGR